MLAQVGEFSFVLERAGREWVCRPAGLGAAGSQAFIATTVVLMVLTPFLTGARRRGGAPRGASRADPGGGRRGSVPAAEGPRRENHVVVAGYGQAARRLVRVLDGSRIPFVITTLSPEGATEAEADGLPGAARRRQPPAHAAPRRRPIAPRCWWCPTTTRRWRIASPRWRALANPTMRIVVRTRYIAEMEPLVAAGADRVIAEELESVVQLFADVMRSYDLPAEEIERNEEAVRRGGYAALRAEERPATPVVECDLGAGLPRAAHGDDPRRGAGGRAHDRAAAALRRAAAPRAARTRGEPPADEVDPGRRRAGAGGHRGRLRAGGAALPRRHARRRLRWPRPRPTLAPWSTPSAPSSSHPSPRAPLRSPRTDPARACRARAAARTVCASATRWVHLRICMTCGHVGCCDSSPNKHATAHYHAAGHPIMRSVEPGETWGWCFVDQEEL